MEHKTTMTETTMETILLVEDEPAVRQLFAQALTRVGYAVYEARNGQEAMKLFDEHGESIDMLLTDMRMPYMGGAELAHHLRGRRRSLKLLCISGYPGNLDAELAIDFLAKPFSREDLLRRCRLLRERIRHDRAVPRTVKRLLPLVALVHRYDVWRATPTGALRPENPLLSMEACV